MKTWSREWDRRLWWPAAGRADGESFLCFGGEDCGAGDALVAREVFLRGAVGCDWRGSADGSTGIFGFVSGDAADAGTVDPGWGLVGTDVSAADSGAGEGAE